MIRRDKEVITVQKTKDDIILSLLRQIKLQPVFFSVSSAHGRSQAELNSGSNVSVNGRAHTLSSIVTPAQTFLKILSKKSVVKQKN